MHTRAQDFTLGLVVLAMIALFVCTVLFLTPTFKAPTRDITFVFRQADGIAPIKKGSPVMLSGAIQVGTVTDVSTTVEPFETPAGTRPEVVIKVQSAVDKTLQLFADCEVTSDQPPVGGGGMIVIVSAGSPDRPPVGNLVRGLPPQSFAAAISGLSRRLLGPDGIVDKIDTMLDPASEKSVAGRLTAIMSDLSGVSAELRAQMTPGEQRALLAKISRFMDSINATADSLKTELDAHEAGSLNTKLGAALDRLTEGLTEVDAILKENRPGLNTTVSSIAHLAQVTDEQLLTRIVAEFSREDPNSLLSQLHGSMDRLNTSLDNVVAITDTGRKLVVMNRSSLQRTIDNLKETSDRLRVGVQELILTPWRLMQPPEAEQRKLDALEAARHFAEAATFLDDTAARLESVANASPDDRALLGTEQEVSDLRASIKLAFERFQTAEKYFYDKLK